MNSSIRIIIVLIILYLSAGNVFSQEQQYLKFNKGIELYTAGNYQDAINEWMDVYNTGYRSPALCYNIGNAYFKLNNVPGAILFYERARLLKPADDNINYNLRITRTLVVDKFEEIPELFFIKWFDFISLIIPANGWAKLSMMSFIFFLISLSLYFYSRGYRIKIISFWTALLLFFITVSSYTFAIRNKTLLFESRKAIIFAPVINGKSSPDESGTDLFVLHEGSKVTIEDEVGEWYEIRLSDGNKGWVPSESLEII